MPLTHRAARELTSHVRWPGTQHASGTRQWTCGRPLRMRLPSCVAGQIMPQGSRGHGQRPTTKITIQPIFSGKHWWQMQRKFHFLKCMCSPASSFVFLFQALRACCIAAKQWNAQQVLLFLFQALRACCIAAYQVCLRHLCGSVHRMFLAQQKQNKEKSYQHT